MSAPKGNRFWEARSSHGRKPKFKSSDDLWDACQQYFEWVDDNPLETSELVKFQGQATIATLPKMRAMTIDGLCMFIDISDTTWANYRGRGKDFLAVTTRVERVIYQQKFTGAAADLLNPNIIARDLGLADKKEHTGKDGAALPAPVINVTTSSPGT